MTNYGNDRRRRPQSGSAPRPGGPARDPSRPGTPSQPAQRSDSPRRGFTPDSGYRPGGNTSSNDPARGRSWGNNQGSRPGNNHPGPRQGNNNYQGPPRQSNNQGQGGPARSGNNQGQGGPARTGNNHQGPRTGNPNPAYNRGGEQGRPQSGRPNSGPRQDYGNNSRPGDASRGGYPPRRQGSYRPNESDNRGQRTNQGRDRYDNSGRPAGGPNRDSSYRDSRPAPQSRPDFQRQQNPVTPAASSGPSAQESPRRSGKIDPFDLFCAYHLGITADKRFRHANLNDVARRFNIGPGEVKQALQDFGMDAGVVMEKEFDMALAQLDIELAPEGIDRVELARQIYADFLEAPRRKIDWKKIIDEDIRENAKIFGRKD